MSNAGSGGPGSQTGTGPGNQTLMAIWQNIATAINNAASTYLQVNGSQTIENITSAKVVKSSSGRVCMVSIVAAGSTTGYIYDSASSSATTPAIYAIPNTLGIVFVNLPTSYGIVVSPGTGQNVSVSYS